METLLAGSLLLSIFHALIPSHWLPVLAVGRQQGWTTGRILWITFLTGSMHVLSTVLLGIVVAVMGHTLAGSVEAFTHWIAPALLVVLGGIFVYRHYRHHHFHLNFKSGRAGVVATLAMAMFLSPCLEIEAYFLAAGQYGGLFVALLALQYAVITLAGMLLWVWLALSGLKRLDWHAWEHNAGLITGFTLILSGLLLLILE